MKRIFTALLVISGLFASAQQDVQFSQYMFNRILYNPAVAGSGDAICVNALARTQWIGFGDGNPQTLNVNVHSPVRFLGGGLGLSITADQLGFQYTRDFRLSYSYHLNLGEGTLGMGASFGLSNVGIQGATWVDPTGGSGAIDPLIPNEDINEMIPDVGLGFYYWTDDWWAGASVSHLVPFSAQYTSDLNFDQTQHLYFNGGYNWDVAPEWEVRPSLLVKTDLASFQLDINAIAEYNNLFYGGVSYRLQDAVAVMLGYNITEQLRVGYAYDITTSQLSLRSNGSHEIMASYCFSIEIPPRTPQKYRNVRFL